MVPRRNRVQTGLICLLLILGILAVYLPVLGFDFLKHDDPEYVTGNAYVRAGLTWSSVQWAFAHTSEAEWHPLTMLSHMLDCQLFGMNPAGHHLVNLLLHLANSLVLFFALRSLSGALWPAAFVAALFAVHPMNVEAVAWVAERKGLLSTFFGLLCLYAYARYVKAQANNRTGPASTVSQTRRRLFYFLALLFLALGLLSKPMLITWPFLLLLLDYWPLGRIPRANPREQGSAFLRLTLEKLPFFALALGSTLTSVLVGKSWGAITSAAQTPLASRVSNSLMAYVLYLQKLFWPSNLSISYPFVFHWPVWEVLAAIVFLGILSALAISQYRKHPYLTVGWAWYLGTLVPVIGLVHFGNHFMADRYAYVTTIGLFIMLAWAGCEFAGGLEANAPLEIQDPALATQHRPETQKPKIAIASIRQVALVTCSVAILVASILAAQSQLLHWQNTETVFRQALSANHNDFVAYQNLGCCFQSDGELAQAERFYRAALAINPRATFALERLASVLLTKGQIQEASAACLAALALDPNGADSHCSLGQALMKQGKRTEALEQYAEAIRLKPQFALAHYNLANALAAQGQFAEARDHYRESIRWDPDSPDAHSNLAYLLMSQGNKQEAVAQFRVALRLQPGMWQAHYGLADALARQGHSREAADHYRQALRSHPDFPEALTRLAWFLATEPDPALRNGTQAVVFAERACRLTGYKQIAALRALAAAYAENGRFTEAVGCAEKALVLAQSADQKETSQKLQELIELFRAGRPYRGLKSMPSPSGPPSQRNAALRSPRQA